MGMYSGQLAVRGFAGLRACGSAGGCAYCSLPTPSGHVGLAAPGIRSRTQLGMLAIMSRCGGWFLALRGVGSASVWRGRRYCCLRQLTFADEALTGTKWCVDLGGNWTLAQTTARNLGDKEDQLRGPKSTLARLRSLRSLRSSAKKRRCNIAICFQAVPA
jgi:hypothetical protein